MSAFRKFVNGVLKIFPNEGKFIKIAIRKLLVQKELSLIKLSHFGNSESLPDPRTVYWIDPRRIELHTALKTDSADWEDWVFSQRGRLRMIQDGDWDISDLKVADMRICRAVEDRIGHGAPWSSTEFYQTAIRQIESGRHVWRCVSRSDFDQRCAGIDKLIESMAKNGYQASQQLGHDANIVSSLGHQEIIVNISRDGWPLFQDGRHRLAIARTLGIEKIPVQILVRHKNWQAFRSFLCHLAPGQDHSGHKGLLEQTPIHFDLADIPNLYDCEDRWLAISAHLPTGSSGLALDIGCNLGYFCHGLESLGYSPIGIEYRPDLAYAAEKIARSENRAFPVIIGDIVSKEVQSRIIDNEYSVVLAINVLQHLITTESNFKRLEVFMKNLRCRTMFFEPHHPDSVKIKSGYMKPTPEEFAEMIGEWGRFQSVVPIHRSRDGRMLFVLNR